VNGPPEIAGTALRVRFVRLADRYSHVIDVRDGGDWRTVLESVEGSADDAWPTSPPLQDVHIEQRPDGLQVALAVGRAGRSHWSLSIALDPASEAIEIDAACRTSERPGWLGSTYRSLWGEGIAMEALEGVEKTADGGTGTISLRACLVVESGNQTIRWRYRIGVGKNI
jgi:hypothetical protein